MCLYSAWLPKYCSILSTQTISFTEMRKMSRSNEPDNRGIYFPHSTVCSSLCIETWGTTPISIVPIAQLSNELWTIRTTWAIKVWTKLILISDARILFFSGYMKSVKERINKYNKYHFQAELNNNTRKCNLNKSS